MNAVPAPAVYTIPPHRGFADALAAGLIARFGGDPLGLARGIVLLPNNRAVRAVTDAFVRRAEAGLLLPRLIAIGDTELGETLGGLLDPADGDPVPPAIDPMTRLMILARLVSEARTAAGDPAPAAEAVRLAAELARTLDQLLVEEVDPTRLTRLIDPAVEPNLAAHWQTSLATLELVLARWPGELAARGRLDAVDRRNRLLDAAADRWRATLPQAGFVVAAGITTSAPAVARLLRVIATAPGGMVVFPGLDLGMAQAAWDALGPHEPDPDTGRRQRAIETHPQFHLKLLLDRMHIGRGEVRLWRRGGAHDAPATRTRAIGHAMTPAIFTGAWATLRPAERRLTGVRALELDGPAEEAQAIAIALREAIEIPGRTAALITPDRVLARRVAAHLNRWGISADDSAGRPLSATPAGALLLALAEAAAEGFAPVALLALLKHPLVQGGDKRLDWLDGARRLDRALRGPRPAAGLAGVTRHLGEGDARERKVRAPAAEWWGKAVALLEPLEAAFADAAAPATLIAALRDAASALGGDAAWSGPDGRAAADMIAALETAFGDGPARATADDIHRILRQLMETEAVRPPQGGHPRISIWGLLEARLQQADLVILGGLNEGTWPAAPSPDPWLAPAARAALGLPGLERRIGLASHDFASALGARQVLVTRARRDARAPAIASRLWLRLEAMTGGLTRAPRLKGWARALDRPLGQPTPADRPAPCPPTADRPKKIAVTRLDRLKADPFAFYADAMLGLSRLDAVDADPGPAWRGSAVHRVFDAWLKEDGCDPATLLPRARAMLDATAAHPVLRALWTPRLIEAVEWVGRQVAENRDAGRAPIAAEIYGEAEVSGIRLYGTADRIDRLADGGLAIVDYKTGKAPGGAQVAAGFAMQLGLLGLIAEKGGFKDVDGTPAAFEYWSLAAKAGELGHVASPTAGRTAKIAPEDFTGVAASVFEKAATLWLTGTEPFVAKLHPEHAPYADYDQLMRLDEWQGRDGGGDAAGEG
ncbi:double-strand break repair protein AddB [Sphingomonas sp. KC8]|uniref:double-strand break repair protein AddB n=1 Tax=Sphingomonas sp. KC8 TaxID=1030157 RepID=UPI000248852A|nr:double-strand break repair protein AddB [Sphingomonas sp. KC8]ARS26731.1 double-strand break repair protein AddB [Sphingomonas sp. KC8]